MLHWARFANAATLVLAASLSAPVSAGTVAHPVIELAAGHGHGGGGGGHHGAGAGSATPARQSNNWSGYNQGYLERGVMFHSISGDWTVPTAGERVRGQNEYSATWVGIGGGCIDSACDVTDGTLIQAGTEQDVAGGSSQYSAWYELIPAPSITISSITVRAGDAMHVSITEEAPEVWSIVVEDLSDGQSFTTTVPYSSSYATAEWILETPIVCCPAAVGPLPNLSTVRFDAGTANGTDPGLVTGEGIQLVDFSGNVLATPSPPDGDTDGFNDCSYASGCAAPASS